MWLLGTGTWKTDPDSRGIRSSSGWILNAWKKVGSRMMDIRIKVVFTRNSTF
jgi:hypothetical protein